MNKQHLREKLLQTYFFFNKQTVIFTLSTISSLKFTRFNQHKMLNTLTQPCLYNYGEVQYRAYACGNKTEKSASSQRLYYKTI